MKPLNLIPPPFSRPAATAPFGGPHRREIFAGSGARRRRGVYEDSRATPEKRFLTAAVGVDVHVEP
jgi:hypothetical protein